MNAYVSPILAKDFLRQGAEFFATDNHKYTSVEQIKSLVASQTLGHKLLSAKKNGFLRDTVRQFDGKRLGQVEEVLCCAIEILVGSDDKKSWDAATYDERQSRSVTWCSDFLF